MIKIKQNKSNKIKELMLLARHYKEAGNIQKTEDICLKILKEQPNNADALYILGVTLHQKGQFDEAISYYQKAIKFNSYLSDAHNALGILYIVKGKSDDAITCFQNAANLNPTLAEPYYNLGLAYKDKRRLEESIVSFKKAIQINHNFVDAHWSLSHALLLCGNFQEGWKEYKWRWKTKDFIVNQSGLPHPLWDGFDIKGQIILLQAEQGFGDTIQFIRYAPLIAQRCARVIIGCHKELKSILSKIDGISMVIAYGETLPQFDVRCRLLDLPLIFQTTLDNIPAKIPYMQAESLLVQKWRDKIQHDNSKLRIGLVWAGSSKHKNNYNRSFSPEIFSPLAKFKGITFYSLQKGEAAQHTKRPPEGMHLIDYTDEILDFSDTAALIENLDLIISVDTSVAHLAGALGKPVWVLLPFVPDWRWMLDRADSPWYPTMRLFRQHSPRDWGSVIELIKSELVKFLMN
jgi:tetratricopeptide (TPR) repeat protein